MGIQDRSKEKLLEELKELKQENMESSSVLKRHSKDFWLNRAVLVCAYSTIIIGLVVLSGWYLGLIEIISLGQMYVPMAEEAALLFILTGIALDLIRRNTQNKFWHYFLICSSGLIGIVTLLALIDFGTSYRWDLSNFIGQSDAFKLRILTGKMSPVTAICFLFVSIAILLLRTKARKYSIIFSSFVLFVGYTIVVGYSYGVPFLYSGSTIPMAWLTAIAFIVSSTGLLLAAGKETAPVSYFMEDSTRARLMRSILPVIFLSMFIHDFIDAYTSENSSSATALSSSIVDILVLLATGFIISFISRSIGNSIDKNIFERKLAEQALQKSEKKFRNYIDYAPLGVFVTDMKGQYVEVNAAASQITGYSQEELLKMNLTELIPPDLWTIAGNHFNQTIDNENSPLEIAFLRKDGSKGYWEVNDIKLSDERILGFVADITERKLTEAKIREKDSEFRKLSSNVPGMIYQFTRKSDGTYIVPITSEGILEIFGCTPEDVRHDFSPISRVIVPEDLDRIFAAIEYSAKHLTHFSCEYRVKRDGKEMQWISARSVPEKLEDGIITWYGFNSDITDLKKTEEELLISENRYALINEVLLTQNEEKERQADQLIIANKELHIQNEEKAKRAKEINLINKELLEREFQYRNLANSGPALVWTSGTDKLCNYFNNTWLSFTGRTLEQEMGNGWTEGVHPDDIADCVKTYLTAFDQKVPFEMEYRVMHVSGEYKWIVDLGTPNYNSDGEFIGYIGNCFDIAERKITEQQLVIAKDKAEESDRLKSAFLSNMSHEIRTPMNGILGFAELLKEPGLTGDQQQDYVRIINKSGLRMLNIINDIIDISKIESGLMMVDISKSNINEQIEYIHSFFKTEVERKGMQLFYKNTLPAKEATIYTDREKFYAIFTNLVKNAIKYTDQGSIEFGYQLTDVETHGRASLQDTESILEFYVKDTGIGIHPDRHKVVFERFVQADISDSRAFQGAGLGLSIAKAYVEMLGGKIRVESESGKGSTFYFTLPYRLHSTKKNLLTNDNQAEAAKKLIKKLKILVAEDDEISQDLLSISLQPVSYELQVVTNGVEAVEACRNHPDIDLVLMDIQMPLMDGYKATREIRKFNTEIIIIAQTAFGLKGDQAMAIEAGCNDYISKPINSKQLHTLINKHFQD